MTIADDVLKATTNAETPMTTPPDAVVITIAVGGRESIHTIPVRGLDELRGVLATVLGGLSDSMVDLTMAELTEPRNEATPSADINPKADRNKIRIQDL